MRRRAEAERLFEETHGFPMSPRKERQLTGTVTATTGPIKAQTPNPAAAKAAPTPDVDAPAKPDVDKHGNVSEVGAWADWEG